MTNIVPLHSSIIPTMSSSQFAELLGKEKKEINRKIRKMFAAEIDGGKIPPSLDSRGYVDEYHLPEVESNMFVASEDATHLREVCEFFVTRKKAQPKLPNFNNPAEAARAWANAYEQQQIESKRADKAEAENVALVKDNTRLNQTCNQLADQFAKGLSAPEFCMQLNGVNTREITNYLKRKGVFIVGPHGLRPSCIHRDTHFKYSTKDWSNSKSGKSGTHAVITLTVKGAKWLYKKYIKGELPMKKTWNQEFTHNILDDLDFAK